MEIRSEEWELVSFFHGEPTLTDTDAPWCYNRIVFESQVLSASVFCTLEPGDDFFHLVIKSELYDNLEIQFLNVDYIEIRRGVEVEWLVVVTKGTPGIVLVVVLSPSVAIRLRMTNDTQTASLLSSYT
jgi:hypothetical protein